MGHIPVFKSMIHLLNIPSWQNFTTMLVGLWIVLVKKLSKYRQKSVTDPSWLALYSASDHKITSVCKYSDIVLTTFASQNLPNTFQEYGYD